MKKPKVKLDSASIQNLLVRHCEKIILVLVLGVMVWLVYQGYSLPGLESGKTPDGLLQASQNAGKYIDDPNRWTAVRDERLPTTDLVAKVREAQQSTDAGKYLLPQPWSAPNFPKLTPRQDPQIFAPERVIVYSVRGPLAVPRRSKEDVDPLYPLASEDDEEIKRPVAKKAQPPSDPYGMMGSNAPGYGASGSSDGYGRGAPRGKAKKKGPPAGSSGSSGPGYGYGPEMGSGEMMGPGYGMPGGYGGYGQTPGGINPESVFGFQGGQGVMAKDVAANVVMAVVPFEQQAEEFLNALKDSLDFSAERDLPKYLMFQIQRAEVSSADPDAEPSAEEWTKTPISAKAVLAEQIGSANPPRPAEWAGVLPEIVDPAYLDPALMGGHLTHPAPPFLQRDSWPLLTHPDVPLAPLATMSGYGRPGAAPGTATPETPGDTPPIEDLPGLPTAMPGGGYGGDSYGSGSASYGGSGMMPGATAGYGMPSGGMMGGSMPGMMSGSMPGSMGGMESGYGYGSGDVYGGSMGGYGGATVAPPKYKLIRFTDTKIVPGKLYRYRVRVLLNDPNNPDPRMAAPLMASLDEKVRERIRALQAADAKKGDTYKTYWIESPWSEPSPVAKVPTNREYYAGEVTPAVLAPIVEGKPRVSNNNPKANVLAKVWEPAKIVDVPVEQEVTRGAVLNVVPDVVKVIHPVTRRIVEVEKLPIRTNAIVADIQGGETIPPLERKTENALKAPGEVLVVDPTGKIFVQNEADDIEAFRRYLPPKEDANKPPAGTPGMMMSGSEGYDPYSEMMTAPSTGRGRRGRGGGGSSSSGMP